MRHLFVVVALGSLAACGSEKNARDDRPPVTANTLSPEDFHAKAAKGEGIFDNLNNLPSTFGVTPTHTVAAKTAFAVSRLLAATGNIDVTSASCARAGEPTTLNLNGTLISHQVYMCKLSYDGRLSSCKVEVNRDQSGREVSRTQQCTPLSGRQADAASTSSSDAADNGIGGAAAAPSAASFMPASQDVTDCASAFSMFTSLFSQAHSEYSEMASALKDTAAHSEEGLQLTKAAPAADESVAFDLTASDSGSGMSVKGRIAGGGDGDMLVMRRQVDMMIDASKMAAGGAETIPSGFDFGVQKFAVSDAMQVDLTNRKVTSSVNLTMSSTQNGNTSAQSVRGTIELSDGADKFVHQALEISMGDSAQPIKTDLTARLLDAGTLSITGSISGEGQAGPISYRVTKTTAGTCGVTKAM